MARLHSLGLLLAFLFTIVAALPTDLEASGALKCSPAKNKGTKTKAKHYPPTYTGTMPVVTCPRTPYYFQDAAGGYLQATLDTDYLPATSFDLYFTGTSTLDAVGATYISPP